jgi:hypothetical protein
MKEDYELKFKDKEINQVASELTKAGKRQFGTSLKEAFGRASNIEIGADEKPPAIETMPSAIPSAVSGAIPSTPSAQESTQKTVQMPAPATTPTSTPAPAPTSAALSDEEAKKELYSIVKPLRTYERDIAETIRNKNESVASINIAEQKRKEEERKFVGGTVQSKKEVAEKAHKIAEKGLLFLVSVTLLIAGAGITAFIYYFISNRPPAPIITTPTPISTDEQRKIEVDTKNPTAALLLIQQELRKDADRNNLVAILVSENVEMEIVNKTGDTETRRVNRTLSIDKFFGLFAKNAPASLVRSLGPEWLFGFHNIERNIITPADPTQNVVGTVGTSTNLVATTNPATSTEPATTTENLNESTPATDNYLNEPFIFIKISEFDIVFDGMIWWEAKIAEDLSSLTKVSTPNLMAPNRTFQDVIIRNKDTRVLKDSLGNTVLIYSFLDPQSLLITTNEATFSEVLNRFFSSQVVR